MINYGVAILAPPTNYYPLSTTQLSFSPTGCLFIISLHLEKLIHLQCFFFKTPASVRRASGVVKKTQFKRFYTKAIKYVFPFKKMFPRYAN